MFIYYDSVTGNVERFVNKIIKYRPEWILQKISADTIANQIGHLITFTTKFGEVPLSTEQFLFYQENFKKISSISSSGNKNWGPYYGLAADIIAEKFTIPVLLKFELSGTLLEVEQYIRYVENYL